MPTLCSLRKSARKWSCCFDKGKTPSYLRQPTKLTARRTNPPNRETHSRVPLPDSPKIAAQIFARRIGYDGGMEYTKLSPKAVCWVLEELCVRLGYCIPPAGYERLMNDPPTDIEQFIDAVFEAEKGTDERANKRCRPEARKIVTRHFESWNARQNSQN